jgi:hypothetical protein
MEEIYIGIVQYNNLVNDLPRIGHHSTSNLTLLLNWKKETENFPHVDYCQIYKIY